MRCPNCGPRPQISQTFAISAHFCSRAVSDVKPQFSRTPQDLSSVTHKSASLTQIFDRLFEHFVPPFTDAAYCRRNSHVRLKTQALQLAAIGVPDVLARKADGHSAWKNEIGSLA